MAELIGNEHVDIAPRIFGFLTSPTKAPKISSKSAIHTKYVCQYALDGTSINTYDSYEAASNATGFSIKAIQKAVYGERHSTGGFQWRTYRNKNDIKCIEAIELQESTAKPVLQLSLDGQPIAEYPSVSNASKVTGIAKSSIINVLNGSAKTAGGCYWKRADEEKL